MLAKVPLYIQYNIMHGNNKHSDRSTWDLHLFNDPNLNAFFVTNSPDHSDTDVTYLRKVRLKDTYILQNFDHSLSHTNPSILEIRESPS